MFSQNVIEIHPVNGKLDIKYFPVIEEFTNPFYGVSIKPNVDGYYNLDTVSYTHLTLPTNREV